jgi:hypothetical protein
MVGSVKDRPMETGWTREGRKRANGDLVASSYPACLDRCIMLSRGGEGGSAISRRLQREHRSLQAVREEIDLSEQSRLVSRRQEGSQSSPRLSWSHAYLARESTSSNCLPIKRESNSGDPLQPTNPSHRIETVSFTRSQAHEEREKVEAHLCYLPNVPHRLLNDRPDPHLMV